MRRLVGKLVSDRSGAAAIEYGVLAMLVGLGLVLVLESVGIGLEGAYEEITKVFSSAVAATSR